MNYILSPYSTLPILWQMCTFCDCILIFPYPVYAQLLVDASVGGHRSAYISTFYPQSTRDGDPSLSGERATLVAGFNGGPGPQAGLC